MPISAQRSVIKACLERSFWLYFLYGFGAKHYCEANPQDNWVHPVLHRKLADWIDGHVKSWEEQRGKGQRKPKKLLIEIFRGGGKSTMGCALDTYLHIRNPDSCETISSYDKEKSKDFLAVDKTTFEGGNKFGWFKDLWGDISPKGDEREWHKESIVHMLRQNEAIRDPSIDVTSVSKGTTGSRPDIYRLDDPLQREKINDDATFIEKAREHLDATCYAVKSNGLYLIYATPYTENDVCGKIWQEEGVATVTGQDPPFEYKHDPDGWHVFYMPVRDLATGRSVIPQIYPDEYLDYMEAKDPDDFAAQMMCNPAAGKRVPLKLREVKILELNRDHIPKGLPVSVHCDTAYKDAKTVGRGDHNVIQEWHHSRATGRAFYVDGEYSVEWTAREFMNQLVLRLQKLNRERQYPFVVTVDKPPGGLKGAFEHQLFEACRAVNLPCPPVLELERSDAKKDHRIRDAVYHWKSGHVWLNRNAGGLQQLEYEMSNIGFASKKDMADAAADALHPDVYTPKPSLGSDHDQQPQGRPYDAEMWAVPGTMGSMTDDQIRHIYDKGDREDDEKWDEFLQSRFVD
jgi:hypothetical protein